MLEWQGCVMVGGKKQRRPSTRTPGYKQQKAKSKGLKSGVRGGGDCGKPRERSRGKIWKLQARLDASPHALRLSLPFSVLFPFLGGRPSSGGKGSFHDPSPATPVGREPPFPSSAQVLGLMLGT